MRLSMTSASLALSSLLLAALLLAAPQHAAGRKGGQEWDFTPDDTPKTYDRIDPSEVDHPTPRSHSKAASKSKVFYNPTLRTRTRTGPTTKIWHRSAPPPAADPAAATPADPTASDDSVRTPRPTPHFTHDPAQEWSYFKEDPAEARQYTYIDELPIEAFRPRRTGAEDDSHSRRHLRQTTTLQPPPPKNPLYFDQVALDRTKPFPPTDKASTALNSGQNYGDGRPPIRFEGGSTLELAYVHLIFVGNSWDPATVQLYSSPINASIHFMLNVDKSRWWNTARFYGNNGSTTWSGVPGRVQLRQAKILPIPDTDVKSEPNLIDFLEYYLKTKRLDFYVDSSVYFFVLPNTFPNLVSSPGNNDSCSQWCGIHSYIGARFLDETTQAEVYYNITYGAIVHPLSCGEGKLWQCAAAGLNGIDKVTRRQVAPNSFAADAIVNVMAHELAETVIDPYKNAWRDANKAEPADKCNYNFGNINTDPFWWNNRIGKRPYLIQALWHPVRQTCAVNATSDPTLIVEAPIDPPPMPPVD